MGVHEATYHRVNQASRERDVVLVVVPIASVGMLPSVGVRLVLMKGRGKPCDEATVSFLHLYDKISGENHDNMVGIDSNGYLKEERKHMLTQPIVGTTILTTIENKPKIVYNIYHMR